MSFLHEILAAEKTTLAAVNELLLDTQKKFKNLTHFFEGYRKSLKMIEDSPANAAIEDQAREVKPVTTTVYDTLRYFFDIWEKAEDLQFQKNVTNQRAIAGILWNGKEIISGVPVDELMGLEARLQKLREVLLDIPTVDATKTWEHDFATGPYIWKTANREETTKTEKTLIPVVLSEATKEHPAQVQPITKDVVVGKFTMVRWSGAATAYQKAMMLSTIDRLLVEVKQARMRANLVQVEEVSIGSVIVDILLEPLRNIEKIS